MNARKLLEAAIADYGSEARLGAAIGFTQNAVHQAKRRGRITWEMATVLDHVSAGRYPRRLLCPEGAVIRKRINGHAAARKSLRADSRPVVKRGRNKRKR